MYIFILTSNFKKRIFLFILFILTRFPVQEIQAQNLDQDKSFFNNQISEYQYWLSQVFLNNTITVDSTLSTFFPDKLQVGQNSLTLYLNVNDLSVWRALQAEYLAKSGETIERELLDYLIYIMDLEESQANIIILGDGILIKLFYSNGNVQTQSTISKGVVEGNFIVKINTDKLFKTANGVVKGNKELIKKEIINLIKQDLSSPEYRPKVDEDKFEIIVRSTSENVINIIAKNVTKRVIPGNILGIGYYELLDYWIELNPFSEDSNKIEIKFKIRGKYGSGWFAPKNERYKPMAPRYQMYLNDYSSDLIDAIIKKLKDE